MKMKKKNELKRKEGKRRKRNKKNKSKIPKQTSIRIIMKRSGNGIKNEPHYGTPSTYENELQVQGKRIIRDQIGANDPCDKEDYAKDIRKKTHTINLSKETQFVPKQAKNS